MINGSKVNVYIFGAGASKHVGAPLIKDFLLEGFFLLLNAETYEVRAQQFAMVAKLIDTLYGTRLQECIKDARRDGFLYTTRIGDLLTTQISDEDDRVVTCIKALLSSADSCENLAQLYEETWLPSEDEDCQEVLHKFIRERTLIPLVNIEDLLSFVDIALLRKETWLPFEEIRGALHEFVFTTLEKRTELSYSDRNPNCYDKLVDDIMPVDEINCMITFNYDLFLDEAHPKSKRRIPADYNIEFASVRRFPEYERLLSRQRREDDVHLLKLHGSLNWAQCPHCPPRKQLHLAHFQEYREIFKQSCPSCGHGQLLPVLVPPTFLKRMYMPLEQSQTHALVHVWNRAEHFLQKADTLTIIGYSFPDADIEAKWLFKRAIARNPGQPALTLVEPKPVVRRKVLNSLGHFFQEEPVLFETFEKYCDKQIIA